MSSLNNRTNRRNFSIILFFLVVLVNVLGAGACLGINNNKSIDQMNDDNILFYRIDKNLNVTTMYIHAMNRFLEQNDFNGMKSASQYASNYCTNAIIEAKELKLSPKFAAINSEHIEYLNEIEVYFKKYEEWAVAASNGDSVKMGSKVTEAEESLERANLHLDNLVKMWGKL